MGFTEKCVAAGVAEEVFKPLSPLRPDQMAELAKEAYSIAYRIANVKMNEKSPAESSESGSCQKQLDSLFTRVENIHDGQLQGAHRKNESVENSENSSPRQQKRRGTFTKETEVDNLVGSPAKEHKRQGTFTKEEPVENLASTCTTQSAEKKEETKAESRVQKRSHPASKMQPPTSRLMRYNNCQSNLAKAKVQLSFSFSLSLSFFFFLSRTDACTVQAQTYFE